MKFRIRELSPGYRLEVAIAVPVPGADVVATIPGDGVPIFTSVWIPVGHPFGSVQSAKFVAEEMARAGRVVEEFDVEPVAASA